jgi:hypothetical protein
LISCPSDNYYVVILSYTIVLFPGLDTLFIFPLICNTLGNNLHSCFPDSRYFVKRYFHGGEELSNQLVYNRTVIFWRLMASVPPIMISLFINDISLSLQLAGICGKIVSLMIPALLQRYSKEKLNGAKSLSSTFLLAENPYSSRFSDNVYTNAVLIIAFICLAICMCQVFVIM